MQYFIIIAFILLLGLQNTYAISTSTKNQHINHDSTAFRIVSQTKKTILSKDMLMKMRLEHIKMDYSRAYPGILMNYQGIRLCDLLKDYSINPRNTLEFIAEDNFSVLIPAYYLLNCDNNKSIAYLVIEIEKWPLLFNHTNTTAGPYALIWTNPERSYISDEYWGWSITQIIEHATIKQTTVISSPKNLPQALKKQILNGYNVYVSHCSSCHTINHIGKAVIGPDLSWPTGPLDYYPKIEQLKKFIRDPNSVRQIPNSRMSGSSYVGLHDDDLDDLISYFKFMDLKKKRIM